jgi:hypothetical protein
VIDGGKCSGDIDYLNSLFKFGKRIGTCTGIAV